MSSEFGKHWSIEPDLVFLNHGSYGACPNEVLAAQSAFRARMEHNPEAFFTRDLESLLDAVRLELGKYLDADADDLALLPNATTGVNTVLRSLAFRAGEELLTTNHAYNACKNALEYTAAKYGARVVVANVPFPLESEQQVIDAILQATTARTKLALIDHVTSPTALVFPIERIVRALKERGVDTLVDGAHAPGMLPLSLREIGAAYYTGNCHKWMCAPKGAAILHVAKEKQSIIRPLAISHAANSRRRDRTRFRLEFDWGGTTDPSAYLAVPPAIATLSAMHEGGIDAIRDRNHNLALEARALLMKALNLSAALAPDTMIGSMVSLPLPDSHDAAPTSHFYVDSDQKALRENHRIEVPTPSWPAHPKRLIRISAHLYNDISEYEQLAQALTTIFG